jgi:hypothetical protein
LREGFWSPRANVLAQTGPRTTAGDKGRARETLSQNENDLHQETEEDGEGHGQRHEKSHIPPNYVVEDATAQ